MIKREYCKIGEEYVIFTYKSVAFSLPLERVSGPLIARNNRIFDVGVCYQERSDMKISVYVCLLSLLFVPVCGVCSEKAADKSPAPKEVDFFQAMEDGLIDASIVTYSSLDARVTIRNKTKEPLQVDLPDTFAAVHVFQFEDFGGGMDMGGDGGMRGGGGRSGGGGGRSGGGQSSGGGGLGRGGGGGGGMFNLAPEQVYRQNVKTVCLEHGKREPRKHMKYAIRPLDSVTDKKEVHVLCSLVGTGAVDQKSAQAAVWHYNNDMSWEELARKQHKPRVDSPKTVPYFSRQQMVYAMQLGKKVEERLGKGNTAKSGQSSHSDSYMGNDL